MSNDEPTSRVEAALVSVLVTSLSLWVGAATFFSAGVLPTLFLNLETSEAGRIAALLFPAYFRAGLAVGVVATGVALVLARGAGRAWKVVAAVLAVMTLCQGWSALVLHPEMAAIRGVDAAIDRFQELHRLSVRLNSVVLLGGLALLAASGRLLRRRDAVS